MTTIAEDRAAGITGGAVIKNGETATGSFFRILILADAVFDTEATVTQLAGFESLEGVEVPAGENLYGVFTTVRLLSGKAIVYNEGSTATLPAVEAAPSQILRPNAGAYQSGNMAPFGDLDDDLLEPETSGDGEAQSWDSGSGITDPALEFELPIGAISTLRVWMLCRGTDAFFGNYALSINGSKDLVLLSPAIVPGESYEWITFDINGSAPLGSGWEEITSLKLELNNTSAELEQSLDIDAIYIEAIP